MRRQAIAPTLIDTTLVYLMGAVFFFYILVLIVSFQNLPPIPSIDVTNVDAHHAAKLIKQAKAKGKALQSKGNSGISGNSISQQIQRASIFPQTLDKSTYLTIPHPAAELSESVAKNEELASMDVPPFWDPPSVFKPYGGIRKYLGYGERLMTPEEATSIGSYVTIDKSQVKHLHKDTFAAKDKSPHVSLQLETVFIAIASYRDFQCRQTIESIFSRATYPQRIRVGVVDQYDFTQDTPCSTTEYPCQENPNQILCKYKDQIDFYDMNAQLAVGPVFARHLGYRMYRGEYFAAQSDAHVDFIQDWDTSMISQWKSANNEMAVLTAYLSDVQGSIDPETGASKRHTRPIMCESGFEGAGKNKHLRHGQQPEGPAGIKGEPTLEPFWAAGFSFSRGHFLVNVPYDQHLPMIFQGEEISIGLRGFTYGYDYYTPEKSVCFHYYASNDKSGKRSKVKMFWENTSTYSNVGVKAMERLNGILNMNPEIDASEWIHDDEKMYGLGKVRTTQKFFETYGIDVVKKRKEDHLCKFVGRNMQKLWKPHLRENRMGINYDEIDYKFLDPDVHGVTW